MKLAYRAFERSGREVSDALEAASIAEAREVLRKRGLFVVELVERSAQLAAEAGRLGAPALSNAPSARSRSTGFSLGNGRTQRLKDVTGFFRQLSVLVTTGTPMVDALAAIERQATEGRWRDTVAAIRTQVEEGSTLASAMENHPRYFDAVCRSLISAGESGGKIDDMLRRLSALTRQQLKVRSAISGAMAYPILLLCVCAGVLCVMMGFVLPRFEGLFQTLGAPLPPTTKLLMQFSANIRQWWWAYLIILVAASFGGKVFLASPRGQLWLHRTLVRLPIFGRVFRSFATARVTRVLGVLVEGKVPLLDALRLTRDSTGNLCYAGLVARAEEEVIRGGNVSAVFAATPLISQAVTEAVRSGEKTGQIGPVMTNLAEFMDEDNEVVLRSITSLIEPIILITLGLLVGFVAISMFLPLFDLATTAQGGPR